MFTLSKNYYLVKNLTNISLDGTIFPNIGLIFILEIKKIYRSNRFCLNHEKKNIF